jgi:hypothetical protein
MQDHAMHGIMDLLAQTASAPAVQSGLIMQQITQHAMDIPVQQEKYAPEVLVKLFVILAAAAKNAAN